jgi:REP element-mobilizing transposase RayT
MAHTYGSCLYHFVFSTRDRANTIDSEWMERLWGYMVGIASKNEINALCIGGTENHIHALLMMPPVMAPAKGIQLIKGNSSKWIHEDLPGNRGFEWQQGYGVFTIGFSQIAKTRQYIQGQKAHHQIKTFEEEYRAFLKKHMIEYHEDYVWG